MCTSDNDDLADTCTIFDFLEQNRTWAECRVYEAGCSSRPAGSDAQY